jgi:hypothetical protein
VTVDENWDCAYSVEPMTTRWQDVPTSSRGTQYPHFPHHRYRGIQDQSAVELHSHLSSRCSIRIRGQPVSDVAGDKSTIWPQKQLAGQIIWQEVRNQLSWNQSARIIIKITDQGTESRDCLANSLSYVLSSLSCLHQLYQSCPILHTSASIFPPILLIGISRTKFL